MRQRASAFSLLGLVALVACDPGGEALSLSPALWPEGELQTYLELESTRQLEPPAVMADNVMMAAITSATAARAGYEALLQGGSAVDAVMTTTLTEIALSTGGPVTLAGEMVLLYYEAATAEVHAMSATYATVLEEDDPLSIPPQGTPSGRATLVPGVAKGIGAAHERFGVLPWASLFEPAIYFAEHGFEVSGTRAAYFDARNHVITRYPEGREIFLKDDGTPYAEGDWMTQPAMAETLKQMAAQGTDYMYRGPWGEELVEAVQGIGGRLTMEDLDRYEAIWSEPVHTTFRGFDLYGAPLPSFGGTHTAEAFNLFELADLPAIGHPTSTPESLFWLLQIATLPELLSPPLAGTFLPDGLVDRYLPGVDVSPEGRVSKNTAEQIWAAMQTDAWVEMHQAVALAREADAAMIESLTDGFGRRRSSDDEEDEEEIGNGEGLTDPGGAIEDEEGRHTAGVIAIDEVGNMAVLLHSINSSIYGETGLFVGGVSIPDAAAFQQDLVARVGPGQRVPEWDTPTIVLLDGKPYLGSTTIGGGYHEVNIQNLMNVLAYGMEPAEASVQPRIRKKWPTFNPLRQPYGGPGEYTLEMLEAVRDMGMDIEPTPMGSPASFGGAWVGVKVDPVTGVKQGARTPGTGAIIGN
jgi:gamma-glutamyltranspeptidase/glutathione hydrolase